RAVEVDAVELREVGVLAGNDAAGFEIDLPLGVVYIVHVADQPVTLRDLVLHFAGNAVVQVQMLPAIAFRCPDYFLAVVDVVPVFPARGKARPEIAVVEKRLGLLVDQRTRLAGGSIDLDHSVDLMAALVVLEGKAAAVLPPHRFSNVVRIGEQSAIDIGLLLRRYVEQDRERNVQCVSRLGVVNCGVLRLDLICRRGLDVVHEAVVARARVIRHQLFGVGRPRERTQRVVIVLRAVEADGVRRLVALGLDEDVEVLDERFVFAVKRGAYFRRLRWCLAKNLRTYTGASIGTSLLLHLLARRSRSTGTLPALELSLIAGLRSWRPVLHAIDRVAARTFQTDFWRGFGIQQGIILGSPSTAEAASAWNGAGLGAGVVREAALVQRTLDTKLNCGLIVEERQRRRSPHCGRVRTAAASLHRPKRQLESCIRFAYRSGDRGSEPGLIERGLLWTGIGIHEHELSAALYRLRVPEVIGVVDPRRRAGSVHHQVARLRAQIVRALVVGQRSLCVNRNGG